MQSIKNIRSEIIFFLSFLTIIIVVQFLILKPHLNYGLFADDVHAAAYFKSLDADKIGKFFYVWQKTGPHFTNPIYYMGLLFTLFKFNYLGYQIFVLLIKIIATLFLYLLIRVILKQRLAAFLVALVYSIHFGSVGAMEMVARSQDYLVITGLSIFFILYYYLFSGKLKSFKWLLLSSLVLLISFSINPIRAYPVLIFIILIEVGYFLFNRRNIGRLLIILLPYFLAGSYSMTFGRNSPWNQVMWNNGLMIFKSLLNGNLQFLITPITALGSLFLAGDYYRYFGIVSNWNDFGGYLRFILGGPLIIYAVSTAALALVISKNPRHFFIAAMIFNIVLELFLFVLINFQNTIPYGLRLHYDAVTFAPPALLGMYILSLMVTLFLDWRKTGQKIELLIFLSLIFTLTFWIGTWLFADFVYIPTGLNGYTTIPSLGVSSALGIFLASGYLKLKKSGHLIKAFSSGVFLLLVPFFIMSNSQIQQFFSYNLDQGMDAKDQTRIRERFLSLTKGMDIKNPSLFYLDSLRDYQNGRFYSVIFMDRFDFWFYLISPAKTISFPSVIVNNENKLREIYTQKDGILGFNYIVNCKNRDGIFSDEADCGKIFFDLKHFYAFRFSSRDIVDIKEELLENIQSKIKL